MGGDPIQAKTNFKSKGTPEIIQNSLTGAYASNWPPSRPVIDLLQLGFAFL